MIMKNKFLNILTILLLIYIPIVLFECYGTASMANAGQAENFNDDLKKADDYWIHNNLGWDYAKNGDYEKSIMEYKKAIEIIKNMPGDKWPNLKKEDVDRINQQARIDSQIFSRYRLIEVLEKTGRYKEAIENVEWLMKNQVMKGKEEFLKHKLEGMKQNLLQKMKKTQTKSSNSAF